MNKVINRMIFVFGMMTSIILSGPLIVVSVYGSNTSSSANAKWTVMIYYAFDNHRKKEIDRNLEILSGVGSGDGFNLTILVDGTQKDDTKRYKITENELYVIPWGETESNTGDPKTLEEFLKLSMAENPAENYGFFILSDCGSGWQGISHDQSSDSLISIPDFANVFKEITNNGENKVDFVGLDMCITGMVEVAYQISPYVNYMVATEEHGLDVSDKGPEHVWQYKTFLENLKENPEISPEEFAKNVVDSYKPTTLPLTLFYARASSGKNTLLSRFFVNFMTPIWNTFTPSILHTPTIKSTLSALNLSRIQDVKDACNQLAQILLSKNDLKTKIAVHNAREKVRTYGNAYPKNSMFMLIYMNWPTKLRAFDSYIDLYDFAEHLEEAIQDENIKNSCKEVMSSVNNVVLAKKAVQDDPSHGLSIYFPKNKKLYNKYLWGKKMPSPYEDLRFSKDTMWDEFIRTYLKV